MHGVIFTGIPGSGKSTYYRDHFFDDYLRINLDQLRTRNREKRLFELCLALKQPFVVDNTNTTAKERRCYLAPAVAAGFKVDSYCFTVGTKTALSWNRRRVGKAKVPDKAVLAMAGRLQQPARDEGFSELFFVDLFAGRLEARRIAQE